MGDLVGSLLWVISTCATVHFCMVLARRWYPSDSAWQCALHAAVLSVLICIVSLTVVGACGWLSPATILLSPPALAWGALKIRFAPVSVASSTLEPPGAWWLWCGVAGLMVGHCIVNGILRFPTDYDCLMYHQPLMDSWLQSGSLASMQSPRWSDSANSELLGLWFAGAFTGDFWVPMNNLPVMLIWISGVLEVGRRLGLTGWLPHWVAIASIALYTTVHETDDASNDLLVVAFWVAGLAYALRYQASRAPADRLLFALSLGGLAGTKFFATAYALLLGLTFVGLVISVAGVRRGIVDGLLCIGISGASGGYWYVRNVLLTGHLFFPKGSSVFAERIAHPDLSQTTLAFNVDGRVPELLMDAVWRLCGPIHFTLLTLLPTLLLAQLLMGWSGWKGLRSCALTNSAVGRSRLLLALLLGTGLIALITPMLVEDQPQTLNHLRWGYTPVRYSLCFLTTLVLVFGFLLGRLLESAVVSLRQGVVLSLVVCAVAQLAVRFWSRRELDMNRAAIVGAGCVIVMCLLRELWRRSPNGRSAVVGIVLLVVPYLATQSARIWHTEYAQHFNAFYGTQWFDEQEATRNRMLVLDERSYAFFGSRRQHVVWHAVCYRGVDDVLSLVRKHDINIVATRVDTTPQKISRYRPAWEALAESSSFTEVASGRELRMFRFVANNH